MSTPYFAMVKAGAQFDIERQPLSQSSSTSIAQDKLEGAVDILWSHSNSFSFLLGYMLQYYRNFNNESGNNSKNHIVSAEANVKF